MIQITERKPSKRELTIAWQCHSEQAADSSSVKDWSREPSESRPSHQEIGESPHVHDPVTLVILYTITYSRTGSPPQWAPPLYLSRLTYYNLDNLHRPLST